MLRQISPDWLSEMTELPNIFCLQKQIFGTGFSFAVAVNNAKVKDIVECVKKQNFESTDFFFKEKEN